MSPVGQDIHGNPVSATTRTVGDGSYRFLGLVAGTYPISEPTLGGYLDAPAVVGGLGGRAATTDRWVYVFSGIPAGSYSISAFPPAGFLADKASPTIRAVALAAGVASSHILFGLLPPASVSGVVYLAADKAGMDDGNDFGIAQVAVTLAGTDDLGRAIVEIATTDADDRFCFAGPRPGVSTATRGTSSFFFDGPSNVGSLGGIAAPLQIRQIPVEGASPGRGYDFAQRVRPGCTLNLAQIGAVVARGPDPTGPWRRSPRRGATPPRPSIPGSSATRPSSQAGWAAWPPDADRSAAQPEIDPS